MTVMALVGSFLVATGLQPSATESYRGQVVNRVLFVYEGGELPDASRALVEIAAGEPYEPEAIRRSIQQLFALGAFSDIKVEADSVRGGVDVTFRLYPRMTVRAVRLALPPSVEDLRGRLLNESRIRPGDPLDVAVLSESAERLRAALRSEGFLWASVEPEASFQSPTAIVVFHVASADKAHVGELRVHGVPPHVESDVRRQLGTASGAPYSRAQLEKHAEAIVNRWKDLGFYEASIETREALTEDRKVDLDITPHVGPKVLVEVQGFDFTEKQVKELVPILEEERLTADLVEESRANFERYLLERGYRDTVVTVERDTIGENVRLILRFVARPGTRFEVARIEIEGSNVIPREDLRALMLTPTRRFARSAPYQRERWDDDLRAVRRYLRSQGFHAVRVEGRERPAADADSSQLVLVAVVHEGPRAMVDSLQLEGAKALGSKRVLSVLGISPGDPYDASAAVEARERVLTLYRNEGFRSAEVLARTSLDTSQTRALVSFAVTEGERTLVDRIIVSGLRTTRESAVDGLLRLAPGEPLSSLGLLETRQELVGSGLFRRVDIEVLPADPSTQRSDVLISVEEGPRTTFAYGFGYEERQLARAEVELTRRNLFGLNRTVSVFTRASIRGGRFITTYRQPELFGMPFPVFVSGFAEEEERPGFKFNRIGTGLQLSKRVDEEQNLFFRYRFDRTKVFDVDENVAITDLPIEFRSNVLISAISLASIVDRRDDPLNPSHGRFRILDVEWSARALGTEAPYLKGLAQQFFYFPLPQNMVGAVGVRVGIGATLPSNEVSLLPPVERFFAGGATTLRGFGLDEASPRTKVTLENGDVVEGAPIGGNVLTLLNLELRFPLFGNLRGVVFSDNGAVYRRLEDMGSEAWRYNMGFGFRYDTPLGPLRVDYGFKLDRRTTRSIECPDLAVPCRESMGTWHVSLGHAF